ncbi:MAG: nucleotidyltransferase domain-containing protein [Anaerolineae bacterium]
MDGIRLNSLTTQEMNALNDYAIALQSHFADQLVDLLLFGSKARGDDQPDSDVDVIVVLQNPTTKALSYARALGFDILMAHQVFLSIRVMSRQQLQELARINSLFYRHLRQDGISFLPTSTATLS